MAITTAFIISKIDGSRAEHALLIELPEYKSPNARTIGIYVWEKVKDYLTRAGTVIFVASVIMWIILNFGPQGYVTDISESFGAVIGRVAVPLFAPGGTWLLADHRSPHRRHSRQGSGSLQLRRLIRHPKHRHRPRAWAPSPPYWPPWALDPANAYALMVFCLLYIPCTATIATIHRELGSWKQTIGIILFQLLVSLGNELPGVPHRAYVLIGYRALLNWGRSKIEFYYVPGLISNTPDTDSCTYAHSCRSTATARLSGRSRRRLAGHIT